MLQRAHLLRVGQDVPRRAQKDEGLILSQVGVAKLSCIFGGIDSEIIGRAKRAYRGDTIGDRRMPIAGRGRKNEHFESGRLGGGEAA